MDAVSLGASPEDMLPRSLLLPDPFTFSSSSHPLKLAVVAPR
ncbi:hypothetical protein HMPREF1556_01559 [Porphyromonas sp. oral taxon 278 str. W7784]|nr:hypothetical protein HMPREF1556_01559 [Porphyromonas sp. oral taxon 278 str. W7784]